MSQRGDTEQQNSIERTFPMASSTVIANSIRLNDQTGVFGGVSGQLKLEGISKGLSDWLLNSYVVENSIAGTGGAGNCVGGFILNSVSGIGIMTSAMGTVLQGVSSAEYIKALTLGICSVPYKVSGPSVGVGTGAFIVTGGKGSSDLLYASIRAGLVSKTLAYNGMYSDLELKALSSGIVSLFTAGLIGGGGILGTPSPSFVSTQNTPIKVIL